MPREIHQPASQTTGGTTPEPAAAGVEILDLRHYSASQLRPLLEVENQQWKQRLHWNYHASIDLISRYVDARMLPGFVALEGNKAEIRISGYVFCVYEETKAVIGDIFSIGATDGSLSAGQIERQLAEQMILLLQNSPGTERIESQLLLHPRGKVSPAFLAHGFEVFPRHFMQHTIVGPEAAPSLPPMQPLPIGVRMRVWEESDFNHAARLITEAYAGHLDSHINDQYQSLSGSLRFLHNIIRFPSCGYFDSEASRVLESEATGEMIGLLLGSRIMEQTAHITQICIAPRWRYRGFGQQMLAECIASLKQRGFHAVSLTVTETNTQARRLYERMGFASIHTFDAMVWNRHPAGIRIGLL